MTDVRTKKISDGRYAVIVDGKPTRLIIEKGEPPKYRMRQGWCIGRLNDGGAVSWFSFDQPGLSGAVETVRAIIEAATVR